MNKQAENRNLIYILSTGRTGTNFIHNILTELVPELNITHQTRWSRLLNICGNLPIGKNKPRLMTFLFNTLKSESFPKSTIDPLLSLPIFFSLKNRVIYKNPKIIHLIRDPRDFVTSFMNWKNQDVKKMILHYIVPFWQPSPFFQNSYKFSSWINFSKFEHYCWIWNYKNNLFQKLNKYQENYILIRLEDLINPILTKTILSHIFEFLEIPFKDYNSINSRSMPKVNKSIKGEFPKWKNWSSYEANILEKHCGSLMHQFGYGNEAEWEQIKKIKQRTY